MAQQLSVQQILHLAQRGDENTRANAVKALYNLATRESGQALRLLLRDPSEGVRKIATQAFQQLETHLGGPGSIPPLPGENSQAVPVAGAARPPTGAQPPAPAPPKGDGGLASLLGGGGSTTAASRQIQKPSPAPAPAPVPSPPPPPPPRGDSGLANLLGGSATSAAARQVPGSVEVLPVAEDHTSIPAFQNFERALSGYQDMESRLESAYEALERLRDGALAQGVSESVLPMPALPGRWAAEEFAASGGSLPAASIPGSVEAVAESPESDPGPVGRLTDAHRARLNQAVQAAALGQMQTPEGLEKGELLQLRNAAISLLSPCLEGSLEGLRETRGELAQAHAWALGLLPVAGAFDALAACIREQVMEPAFFEAVGEIGNPGGVALLRDIYGQDRFTFARQFIVHAMVRLPGEEADEFLNKVLDDPDPSIQTSTVNHISVCGRIQMLGALRKRLGKGTDNTDVALAKAIVALKPGDPGIVQALQERLSQTDPEGRLGKALITALGRTRHPDALAALQPYTKSRDRRLKTLAIDAVCELDIPSEQKIKLLNPALREVNLRGEADPRGRAQAAVKVAQLGAESAKEIIKEMAQSTDPEVLGWGCWALGEAGHDQALGLLRKAIESQHTGVRIQVIKAMGQLADPRACESLATLFTDKSDEVRAATAEAMAKLGSVGHTHLTNALEREYRPEVVAACLRAMAITDPNPPSCWERVVPYLENDEAIVRLAAAEAARAFMHDEAVSPLLDRLRDSEHKVRRVSASALWSYGEVRIVPRLLEILADEEDEVRLGGALVLVELGELQRDLAASKRSGRLIAALRATSSSGGAF